MNNHSQALIFDLDGTLCQSGQKVNDKMIDILKRIKDKYNCDLGINGGGTYEKICIQIGDNKDLFRYIFAECGSVVYKDNKLIKINSLLNHPSYNIIQKLIRHSLKFISEADYEINGHFIDVRNGLVYISLVGMQATQTQRELFINADKELEYRRRLMTQLNELNENSNITITYGGQVGISIFPCEWDKIQCLEYIKEYNNIHYFGDRYEENGNDYKIINDERIIGHKINNCEDTYNELFEILEYK